eukprot:TRINITY_DN9821_c0_g1_i1.p1 TRINITY_DN9821_c0_g1~~TRINITY_DN9821_c0_g1_i1.p1  ORF type:complete len:517 (-),score=72.86 TRINITY_DN9821_c0_g1_i1:8-1483(-)
MKTPFSRHAAAQATATWATRAAVPVPSVAVSPFLPTASSVTNAFIQNPLVPSSSSRICHTPLGQLNAATAQRSFSSRCIAACTVAPGTGFSRSVLAPICPSTAPLLTTLTTTTTTHRPSSHRQPTQQHREFHASHPTHLPEEEDLYDLLGIDRNATPEQIKSAYHKLAMKYHPDRNKNDKSAETKLSKINAAYAILKDEDKRRQYDQFGSQAFQNGGPGAGGFDMGAMGDILSQIFGGMGGGGSGGRGDDIEIGLRITFQEAVNGCKKPLSFMAKTTCNPCKGSGAAAGTQPKKCSRCGGKGVEMHTQGYIPMQMACRQCGGSGNIITDHCKECKGKGYINGPKNVTVDVPAGVDNDMTIRLAGQGDAGTRGKPSGHAFIRLTVPEDPVFRREGTDVHTKVPITLSQAVLGSTVHVPTLQGQDVEVKVPPGTQPNEKRVLRGRGIPHTAVNGDSRRGNHFIHFQVAIPTTITDQQKQAMEQFAKDEKPPKK